MWGAFWDSTTERAGANNDGSNNNGVSYFAANNGTANVSTPIAEC